MPEPEPFEPGLAFFFWLSGAIPVVPMCERGSRFIVPGSGVAFVFPLSAPAD